MALTRAGAAVVALAAVGCSSGPPREAACPILERDVGLPAAVAEQTIGGEDPVQLGAAFGRGLLGLALRHTERFASGVDAIVYLQVDASDRATLAAVADDVARTAGLEVVDTRDQQASYAEFLQLFADSPEFTREVTADVLPASVRVAVDEGDDEALDVLLSMADTDPRIRQVVTSSDARDPVLDGVVDFLVTVGDDLDRLAAADVPADVADAATALAAPDRDDLAALERPMEVLTKFSAATCEIRS